MKYKSEVTERDEYKITLKLCEMLMLDGLNAVSQREHSGNRRIDIQVELPGLSVAVECEKYGSRKHAEAVKDAMSRLDPVKLVDVAVAVVFEKGCDTVDDLTTDTILDYCVVQSDDIEAYGSDHKWFARETEWLKCRAGDISNILRNLHRDIGDPERLASRLKAVLETAVDRLTHGERHGLAMVVGIRDELSDRDIKSGAKRALLVVASAALFHARLGEHFGVIRPENSECKWPPQTLGECRVSNDGVREALTTSWRMIMGVDYQPIFKTAVDILAVGSSTQFADAVDSMARWANMAAEQTEGLRHDLLGSIFHAVLDTARYDGSMYTSTPAAVLLAGLAIRNRADISADLSNMKIIDPACGTGTLLMAAAERVRYIMGDDYNPNVMVENVLCGVDINVTAAHMAATTIGMLSPDTTFDNMDVRTAKFGVVDGVARTGSLELYADDGLLPYVDWYGGSDMQVETGESARRVWKGSADLLIMNPPFTRSDLRHDQLKAEEKMMVKRREAEIFRGVDVDRSSSGILFLHLGELLTASSGVMAFVFPSAGAIAYSNHDTRRFLAKKFHIDTIVVPHDPRRFWFSENTQIGEMLVVLRRRTEEREACQPNHTRIINLAINPETVAGASLLADAINSGNPNNCQIIQWPRSRIEKGDWSGVQFYSPHLVERLTNILDGGLFKSVRLGDIASFGGPRAVRGAFTASDIPDKYARFVLYDHKTAKVRSMRAHPNKYLIAKPGKVRQADNAWGKGGLLHLPERLQPNITHVAAVRTDNISIGTSWHAVTPNDCNAEQWSKAMVTYINSTIGVVALLGIRTPRKPLYPRYGVDDVKSLPVPKLSQDIMDVLAATYDEHKDLDLGLWRTPNDVRLKLDKAVCDALGLDQAMVSTMRTELSREPMITGKQYGAQPDLLDRYE